MPTRGYCLISPCRDEARFMRQTLDSVAAQTVLPSVWVIVDDGSTDETPAILGEYAKRFDWMRVVRREDRGRRNVGAGVIEAFYAGLDALDLDRFEYMCKLDLDLILPPDYFEQLMRRMDAEARLGPCSGKAYYRDPRTGELVNEGISDEISVGASKFYRTACFREIGGFVSQTMWDGIDCHRCRMLGWIACSWDDPEIRFTHLRPMGSSHKGVITGRVRHGAGQHFMGTSLAYMTASAAYRMMSPPIVLGGLAMWWGYVRAMLTRQARYDDRAFRRFLRRYHWSCFLRGKARATAMLDRRQQAVWRQAHDDPDEAVAPEVAGVPK